MLPKLIEVRAGVRPDSQHFRKLHRAGVSKAEITRRLQIGRKSVGRILAGKALATMAKRKRNRVREERIHNEAVVDAYGPEEQALGWYYYLEGKIRFPFQAKCIVAKAVSPLRKGETVEVQGMAPEDACSSDMLVLIRWQGRSMAVPLSQLLTVKGDEATNEAIADWHYWVAQGYCF